MAGLLRLSSEASHPGDLNHPPRELSLSKIVVLDTRRPPGLPGPRGLKRLHGPRGAANPMLAKALLRAKMRSLRRGFARENGRAALLAAEQSPPWPAPGVVSGYFPVGSEIDPRPLLGRLALAGWRLALPRITSRRGTLQFCEWTQSDILVPDAFGIPAPADTAAVIRPDLVIAPVLAFDRLGGRLGQGAGLYDQVIRALRATGPVLYIALAYNGQKVAHVPTEDHDERLDGILTETGYLEMVRLTA